MRMFQPYAPLSLSAKKDASARGSHAAAPADVVPQQLFDLVYRIASDYELNWRDSGYTIESHGLQSLAMGILSCFTLNFRSERIAVNDRSSFYESTWQRRPRPENIVRWRAWPTPPIVPTVRLGWTYVMFTENIDSARSLVQDHFWDHIGQDAVTDQDYMYPTYIVSSIREIQCFRGGGFHRTPVIPFFDGQNPPSETGVRWLLNAIHGHAYPLVTRIHNLPLELQEMVLDYTCDGSEINRAYYAGILGVGIPFDWTSNGKPFHRLALKDNRKLNDQHWEHQIHFWNNYVGVSYQAGDGATAG